MGNSVFPLADRRLMHRAKLRQLSLRESALFAKRPYNIIHNYPSDCRNAAAALMS